MGSLAFCCISRLLFHSLPLHSYKGVQILNLLFSLQLCSKSCGKIWVTDTDTTAITVTDIMDTTDTMVTTATMVTTGMAISSITTDMAILIIIMDTMAMATFSITDIMDIMATSNITDTTDTITDIMDITTDGYSAVNKNQPFEYVVALFPSCSMPSTGVAIFCLLYTTSETCFASSALV